MDPLIQFYSVAGEWIAGKEHGRGTVTFHDGNVHEGMWARGKRLDTAKVTTLTEDIRGSFSRMNPRVDEISNKVMDNTYEFTTQSSL